MDAQQQACLAGWARWLAANGTARNDQEITGIMVCKAH